MGRSTPKVPADLTATGAGVPVEGQPGDQVAQADVVVDAGGAKLPATPPDAVPTGGADVVQPPRPLEPGGTPAPTGAPVTPDPLDQAPVPPSEDAALAAIRAEALAKLLAEEDAVLDDEEAGGDQDVLAPLVTGEVRDWGGDVPHLVVSSHVNYPVDGFTQTAYEGCVVLIDARDADRLVTLGGLLRLADDDEQD